MADLDLTQGLPVFSPLLSPLPHGQRKRDLNLVLKDGQIQKAEKGKASQVG